MNIYFLICNILPIVQIKDKFIITISFISPISVLLLCRQLFSYGINNATKPDLAPKPAYRYGFNNN